MKLPRWLRAYDAALALAGAAWLPYDLLIRRPGHPGLTQRFGYYPAAVQEALCRGGRPVWVHAVSVGEALVALTLLKALKARCPKRQWVVSTTTPTGQRLVRERLPVEDTVLYAPWDLTPAVMRALAAIRPCAFLGLESELWPNLLLRLGAAGVPIAVVNGRISERSFQRYSVVRRWLRSALVQVQVWGMQTPTDAQRVIALGVDPGRVHVLGNLKADATPPALDEGHLRDLRHRFGLDGRAPLWIAGSTHPREEAVILNAFRQVRMDHQVLRLLLAPRHPERIRDVERAVRQAGLTARRRSQMTGEPWDEHTVVILDTLGELSQVYALADLVFVGGSLVPHGGHNLLEPAQLGRPILTGPHTHNVQSIADLLRVAQGLAVVEDAEALAARVRQWLAHPDLRRQVGERARAAVAAQTGSTAKTVDLLCDTLGPALLEQWQVAGGG